MLNVLIVTCMVILLGSSRLNGETIWLMFQNYKREVTSLIEKTLDISANLDLTAAIIGSNTESNHVPLRSQTKVMIPLVGEFNGRRSQCFKIIREGDTIFPPKIVRQYWKYKSPMLSIQHFTHSYAMWDLTILI